MDSRIGKGYLVLADITGFTRFIADSELDHSRVILGDILKLIMARFTPHLRIAEVEGDAVFAWVGDEDLPRGETLLEIIEATYVDFRDKQRSGLRTATCKCNACQAVGDLDLKFITHYGDFVLQDIGDKRKPLGTSVNLLHRLTKNSVGENTGWRGYALFTEASLARMEVRPPQVYTEIERYEHLGEIATSSLNLHDRYKELVAERREILPTEDAHFVLSRELSAEPAEVWEWLNDPKRRIHWMIGSDWEVEDRPRGRTSRGATNHCNNSGAIERVLDWRPFTYYTVELIKKPVNATISVVLEPSRAGTLISWRVRLNGFLPSWMLCTICRWLVRNILRTPDSFDRLEAILAGRKAPGEGAMVA